MQMEDCKEMLSRALEMRLCPSAQGSCKRSGWVSKVLMIDLKGNVSGPTQIYFFEEK